MLLLVQLPGIRDGVTGVFPLVEKHLPHHMGFAEEDAFRGAYFLAVDRTQFPVTLIDILVEPVGEIVEESLSLQPST